MNAQDVVLQGDDSLYLLLVQGPQENQLLLASQGVPKREGRRTCLL